MKRTIAILLAALMALCLFTACGQAATPDEPEPTPEPTPDPTPEPDPNAELYGTWILIGGEGEESEQYVAMMAAMAMTISFNFNEDGTGSMDTFYGSEFQSMAYTYTAEGGKLTMVPQSEGESTAESPYRIEDGKLYMSIGDQVMIFSKR